MGMQLKGLKFLKQYRPYDWAKFHMKYEYTVAGFGVC